MRKQIEEELHSKERSKTDLALIEEALRYGNTFMECWLLGSLLLPFFFLVRRQSRGKPRFACSMLRGSTEDETITRWELMEVNNGSNEESREELCLIQTMPQEVKGWEKVSWRKTIWLSSVSSWGFR